MGRGECSGRAVGPRPQYADKVISYLANRPGSSAQDIRRAFANRCIPEDATAKALSWLWRAGQLRGPRREEGGFIYLAEEG